MAALMSITNSGTFILFSYYYYMVQLGSTLLEHEQRTRVFSG